VSDERARRIGLNEALFRQVNEQIESLNKDFGKPAVMSAICECGDGECMERLEIPLGDYERVRADPLLFVVVPGHEIADVESVVEHAEGWDVVRKHDGTATRMAEKTDPRS
jgi:hypothetical protein